MCQRHLEHQVEEDGDADTDGKVADASVEIQGVCVDLRGEYNGDLVLDNNF